jgi:4,5-DOPA dioxygenase extradiol
MQQESYNDRDMPVLFVGHGSPMNGIEDNEFSRGWQEIARTLPEPKAVLCISAHWETNGTFITAMEKPRTLYDFYGFPEELYQVQYPAPGSPWLAQETMNALVSTTATPDKIRGLDHGCWIVMKQMFPGADVPVVQLSLDRTLNAQYHYNLAKELAPLRKKGVLILGSGNMVHNLGMVSLRHGDLNTPFGFDWAIEANSLFKRLIDDNRVKELADYQNLGTAVRLAVPTPEHFLPMLYVLALKQENESLTYFNDKAVGGSLTMTSFIIG